MKPNSPWTPKAATADIHAESTQEAIRKAERIRPGVRVVSAFFIASATAKKPPVIRIRWER